MVAKFLLRLDTTYHPIHDDHLAKECIPTFSNVVSRGIHVFTRSPISSTAWDYETLAMVICNYVVLLPERRVWRGWGRNYDPSKGSCCCVHMAEKSPWERSSATAVRFGGSEVLCWTSIGFVYLVDFFVIFGVVWPVFGDFGFRRNLILFALWLVFFLIYDTS